MKRLVVFAASAAAVLCLSDSRLPAPHAGARSPLLLSQAEARRQSGVSISFFYQSLHPYGRWVNYRPYGYVFLPDVGRGWRPYSDGRWVYNPRYGWVWDSYEPFGWATFHYGWWDFDPRWGWFWVPGTQWAPSWVVWRLGPDFVGWAPMPARYAWGRSYGEIAIVWTDDYWRSPDPWCFTSNRYVGDRHASRRIVPVARNTTYINQSTAIYNTTIINNTIVNQGPDVSAMERRGGAAVTRADVNAVAAPPPAEPSASDDGRAVVNAYLPDPEPTVSPAEIVTQPPPSETAALPEAPVVEPSAAAPDRWPDPGDAAAVPEPDGRDAGSATPDPDEATGAIPADIPGDDPPPAPAPGEPMDSPRDDAGAAADPVLDDMGTPDPSPAPVFEPTPDFTPDAMPEPIPEAMPESAPVPDMPAPVADAPAMPEPPAPEPPAPEPMAPYPVTPEPAAPEPPAFEPAMPPPAPEPAMEPPPMPEPVVPEPPAMPADGPPPG